MLINKHKSFLLPVSVSGNKSMFQQSSLEWHTKVWFGRLHQKRAHLGYTHQKHTN